MIGRGKEKIKIKPRTLDPTVRYLALEFPTEHMEFKSSERRCSGGDRTLNIVTCFEVCGWWCSNDKTKTTVLLFAHY
jgi:hypothetical protein